MVTHFRTKGLTKDNTSLLSFRGHRTITEGFPSPPQQHRAPGGQYPASALQGPLPCNGAEASPSDAEVAVGEGTSAPARGMTAASQLEPHRVSLML